MKRRWLLLPTGIILASALAYFLRGWINDKVIVPFAYLWWRIGIYYHSISEDVWWISVIVITFVICLVALANISGDEQFFNFGDLDSQSEQSPVEELMIWMIKLQRNAYHKWLVANRLGRLARLFLVQREAGNEHHWDGSLKSPVWDLPDAVESYLKSGLKRPPSASEMLPLSSPLKLEPQQVVEYLESQMEDRPNGN